ncbi:DUF2975 domain-containing protein [Solibacillus isronensis]|uniref:DUF2975 domain-containing protein n=1 Tax=Solibacillus isronensis TaxID=412383 RepID=UPI00203D6718|nr:DUF2975 domain-containing protein [Solibacillus isronensis]MCM3723706.1 DUF2975 domain-containing protein [Solibacillus isronensis]
MQKLNIIFLRTVIISTGLLVLSLCVFVLPSLAQETAHLNPEVAYLQYPILLGMYATAIPFFYALYETLKMITLIERESVFSILLEQGLNYIKYCAYIILVLYISGFFLLDYTNALPPLVALIGIVIILITILVATGAAFLKYVLIKSRLNVN